MCGMTVQSALIITVWTVLRNKHILIIRRSELRRFFILENHGVLFYTYKRSILPSERRKKVKDQNCIFCLIAAGDIPSDTIYEDEDFRVILDISPASKGHALILPKEHAKDITELPDEVCAKALPLAKKIAKAIMEATGCDGINILQNNGEAAGQTVKHVHIHIIPRTDGDNVFAQWVPGKSIPEEQKELAKAIADKL